MANVQGLELLNINMLTLNGKILNAFDTPERVDKKSGEIREAKYRIQIIAQVPVKDFPGQIKLDIVNLSVDDHTLYAKLVGQTVRVAVGAFVNEKVIQFYALKGAVPEVLKPTGA